VLRKLPARAEAFLAANRRNSLKSTGARTAKGKARPCLNALKHGRYARLPETPTAAGRFTRKCAGGLGRRSGPSRTSLGKCAAWTG